VGTVIRAIELVLPTGTTLAADPEQIIVTLAAPVVEEEEPEAAPEESDEAEVPDEG
jgi:hypothetical protein